MDYLIFKNRQIAKTAVFGGFLTVFVQFFKDFCDFSKFQSPKPFC